MRTASEASPRATDHLHPPGSGATKSRLRRTPFAWQADPLPQIAQRLFNAPLALQSGHADGMVSAIAERFGVMRLFQGGSRAIAADLPALPEPPTRRGRPYDVLNGVGIIRVQGLLVHKLGLPVPWFGMTGYDGIRLNLLMALNDPHVRAIVLDIDSPGGEVAGCFDLTDTIFKARGSKPIWAILNETAFSAAYCLASAADRITVPRTGGTGSIGVIALLADISKALTAGGVRVNVIKFGARKADGLPVIPLGAKARARFQAQCDATGRLFVNTVARNRGVKSASVLHLQGDTRLGADGVKARLADAVSAPDQALGDLVDSLNARSRKERQKWQRT